MLKWCKRVNLKSKSLYSSECGKIRTKKAPDTDAFYAVFSTRSVYSLLIRLMLIFCFIKYLYLQSCEVLTIFLLKCQETCYSLFFLCLYLCVMSNVSNLEVLHFYSCFSHCCDASSVRQLRIKQTTPTMDKGKIRNPKEDSRKDCLWQKKNVYALHKNLIFPFRYLFCKSDQILRKLRILSLLMKKSLIENFTFCAVMNEKSWSCIKICYFMNVFCRSVFRTQINIYDGAYLRKESTAKRQFYNMIPFMRSKYLYVLYNGFFSWRRLFKPIL